MFTYTLTPGLDVRSFTMVIYRNGEELARTIVSAGRLREARRIAMAILIRYQALLETTSI